MRLPPRRPRIRRGACIVITFLGVIVFATIIIIGVFDGKNGPSMIATYRSARRRKRIRRRTDAIERGDGK